MSTLATTNIKHPSSASNNIVLDASGNVNIDSNTLYVDATNNRVGIGTTTPQSPLTVGATTDFGAIVKISRTDANFNSGMLVLGNGNSTSNFVGVWRGDANSVTTGGQYLNLGGYDGIVFAAGNTALGAQTERMRILSGGEVLIANTTSFSVGSSSATGHRFTINGEAVHYASSAACLYVGRQTTDGVIVSINQAGVEEGSISVSGTTVSYNGAHLSRWSQLPSGVEREEILRGSVLSNLDEMCEWGEEDNEQLNRMKVSDVEGDKNVSGVFQCWDYDDDTYTNDFYCAMTGDFIIRIAEGTPVHRGQLLMSAGDGTAKPQGDGYVQDKTIAKVTSTNVSCTYDDGSYCVPCVLMAC